MARTRSFAQPNSFAGLDTMLDKIQRRLCNSCLSSGELAIRAGGSALAKTANAVKVINDGVYQNVAAANMAALVGTVTNATFNVFVFSVTAAGTLKSYMGTGAATRAAVVFPTVPDGEVVLSFEEINPTATGNFLGATPSLHDPTGVPNTAYFHTPFTFI